MEDVFSLGKSSFKKYDYAIIDETPFLQRQGWNGSKVYSPAILSNGEIDTVIVMLRTSKKEIQEKLEGECHIENVNIIMCYDLI